MQQGVIIDNVNSLNTAMNVSKGLLATANLVFQIYNIYNWGAITTITLWRQQIEENEGNILKILLSFWTCSLYMDLRYLFFTRRMLFCVFFYKWGNIFG